MKKSNAASAIQVKNGKPMVADTPPKDPEPQPGDGPDYHTEHAFWTARNRTKP